MKKKKIWGTSPVGASAYAAVGGKKKEIWGTFGAPNGFKNVTRPMRIPNMCLILKLDNGKVVSMANEQNHRITDGRHHPVRY